MYRVPCIIIFTLLTSFRIMIYCSLSVNKRICKDSFLNIEKSINIENGMENYYIIEVKQIFYNFEEAIMAKMAKMRCWLHKTLINPN